MDAVLTAGGKPKPKDPLYTLTQGGYKAMLDIHGKPMVQWVLDALGESTLVERVVVVGLPVYTDLVCTKPLLLIPDQGGLLENLEAGVDEVRRQNPKVEYVLGVSSDIPAITPEMIDWLIQTVEESDHDIYYNIIERSVMEKRYPGSRRSFTRLKDMEVCGGDMNAVRAAVVNKERTIYQRIMEARKSSFKLASLIGYDTLLYLVLHKLSMAEAEKVVSERLGIRGRAVLCPYAEIGMDVDKPHQLEILCSDLAKNKAVKRKT